VRQFVKVSGIEAGPSKNPRKVLVLIKLDVMYHQIDRQTAVIADQEPDPVYGDGWGESSSYGIN